MNLKHINLIGVELEGGWRSDKSRQEGWHGDGSVSVYDSDDDNDHTEDCDEDCDINHRRGRVQGEFVSPPMGLTALSKFIKDNYPDDVDDSCGMHIHFSFHKDGDYARLMTTRFYGYFLRKMSAFGKAKHIRPSHEFWDRLAGRNTYCCHNIKTIRGEAEDFRDLVVMQRDSRSREEERYHHLNFCKRLHNTLEVRLLPMFESSKMAVAAAQFLAISIERYLRKPQRLRVFKTEIDDFVPEEVNTVEEVYLGEEVLECVS